MMWKEWLAVADNEALWQNNQEKGLLKAEYVKDWPNPETGEVDERAIDIAPECIRFFAEKYGKKLNVEANAYFKM